MTGDTALISVALVHDEGDGLLFLGDVCNMLERIARRAHLSLEAAPTIDTTRVFRLTTEIPDELRREVGVHRAQILPSQSQCGRVVTAKVLVTVDSLPATQDRILKTYNYPSRCVTFHETGAVVRLDVILFGTE